MSEVASKLTREKSMELIAEREEYIQQQMQKITEEEYQSEVLELLEDENYDDEDLKKELNEYLKSIQYDESQVYEEMNQVFQKCLMAEPRKI